MTPKKTTFLADVRHEVEMLKQHATEEERKKLNFETLIPAEEESCIYGQMTGSCESNRSRELMDLCCKRVLDLSGVDVNGAEDLCKLSIDSENFAINGEYSGQVWIVEWFTGTRDYMFLSALEGYICATDSKPQNIIAFLRGETETLEL